jgi:NADH-quinone oxidoreductase subunit A
VHFDYANVLVFTALGIVLCGLMMSLGALLRPSNPQRAKLTTYECGEEVEGDSWINFNIRFYWSPVWSTFGRRVICSGSRP